MLWHWDSVSSCSMFIQMLRAICKIGEGCGSGMALDELLRAIRGALYLSCIAWRISSCICVESFHVLQCWLQCRLMLQICLMCNPVDRSGCQGLSCHVASHQMWSQTHSLRIRALPRPAQHSQKKLPRAWHGLGRSLVQVSQPSLNMLWSFPSKDACDVFQNVSRNLDHMITVLKQSEGAPVNRVVLILFPLSVASDRSQW